MIALLRERGQPRVFSGGVWRGLTMCHKEELREALKIQRGGRLMLSPSQVDTFYTCGRRWWYRYRKDRKRQPTAALTLGNAYHVAAQAGLTEKLGGQPTPPVSVLEDAYVEKLHTVYPELPNMERLVNPEHIMESYGRRMVRSYHRTILPQRAPVRIEYQLDFFPEGVDYGFTGRIDLEDERGFIIDNKTRGKRPTQGDVDGNLALTLYAEMMGREFPTPVAWDVCVKTKDPYTLSVASERRERDRTYAYEYVAGMMDAIAAGVFLPAKKDVYPCTRDWCGYYPLCFPE